MAMTKPSSSQITYSGTTVNKVLEKSALSYETYSAAYAAAATLPTGQVVDVAETNTRYDVSSGNLVNARPTTPLSALTGVVRSVQDKLGKEFVSIKDFGAIGDGVLHPLSESFTTLAMAQAVYPHATSLSQSIDWAATVAALTSGASKVYAPDGHYMMTDNVTIIPGVDLYGDGVDYWDSWRPNSVDLPKSDAKGTHWYFVGTGAKAFTCDDLSNVVPAKTVNGITFDFTKFTLEDSVAGSPATPRAFSVGFIVNRNSGLKNCRVIPNYDRLQGYIDGTGLSDEWDVGVWALAPNDCDIHNVQSVGHWRMAGFLLTEHDNSTTGPRNPERANFSKCWGAGVRGLLARNTPQYKVTAWSSSSVTVDWNPSFTLTRAMKFRIGAQIHTFSGYTFDAVENTVTLTGVSPAITANPNVLRCWNMGNNFSNTVFSDSVFSSIDHVTRKKSTELGLPVAGAAEYDGFPMRNLVHINTKFQTTFDDLNTLWGGCYDFKYVACGHENGQLIAYDATQTHQFSMNLRFIAQDGPHYPDNFDQMTAFTPRSAYIDSYQIAGSFADRSYSMTPLPGQDMRLRFPSGEVGVNLTAAGLASVKSKSGYGFQASADGNNISTAQNNHIFRVGGGVTNALRIAEGGVEIQLPGWVGGAFRPLVDKVYGLGSSANRFSVVFVESGTISTSDAREKTSPMPIDDAVLDAWGDVQLITFRWLYSIQEKGEDGARWHFGVIAQQVRDAFAARGLDGTRYGLLCYDEWEDEYEPVMAERVNENGEVEEYDTGEVRLVREAGNRWGIRADQCLFLEAAYQRRERARDREEFAQFKQEVLQRLSQLGG